MPLENRRQALVAALKDPEEIVRGAAARALDRVEGMARMTEILGTAASADKPARIRAIHFLGSLDTAESVDRILAFLQDPEPDIRVAVVQAVASRLPKRAYVPLLTCLDDPDPSVVQGSLLALSRYRDPKTTDFILPFLQSDDSDTAAVAAEALGLNGDPRAEAPLLSVLGGPGDPFLRARAAEALGNLQPPLAAPPKP